MPVIIAFVSLMGASLFYVLIWGGYSERAAVLITIMGVTISPIVANQASDLWQGSETGILLVDVIALAAYAAIMLVSNRFWPIWTTAFQLLTVSAHLGPLVRRVHIAFPFAFDEEIWAWVILVQLMIVTWMRTRSRSGRRRL